jgi:hypothetical protein
LIRSSLSNSHFDFVRITGLQTSAGSQSRMGSAEFRVFARGSLNTATATVEGGSATTDWSLGFQETQPGIWKVSRITPIALPYGVLPAPGTLPPGNPLRGRLRRVGMGRRGIGGPSDPFTRHQRENTPGRYSSQAETNQVD